MYSLYSNRIFLNSLSEKSPFYLYHYYNFLRQIFKYYASYLGYEHYLDSKIERILTDKLYQKIYKWEEFPDKKFIKIWLICLEERNTKSIEKNYNYLEKKIIKIEEHKFKMSWVE